MSNDSSITSNTQARTHYRACHLCEAICGLEIKTVGDEVISIKGDPKDPVSHGFICPKATAITDIHTDPDRIRKPIKRIRNSDGEDDWQEISWQEAIDFTAKNLVKTQEQHGANAVGFYAGNPGVHNYGNITHGPLLRRAIKTQNNFSATSLDQLPHHLASYTMYGHQFFLPIPDIDHTDLVIILGGNPIASNGSMMTMPNAPKRLKALQRRGGQIVVIDPRRTETAEVADQHLFIRPASDAFLLMAIINTLFTDNLVKNTHIHDITNGLEQVRAAAAPFTLKLAEQQTGIDQAAIRELTYSLANTEKAVLYGRMGVSVQEFGGLCQWSIQVINILIGALDTRGGTLLSSPTFAYVKPGASAGGHFNRFQSRVSGLPEFSGELPAACMAEEMLTEGEGQIKAMVTIAGNPLNSSVNANDLDKAFAGLDFYVAIDFYVNSTTRHADIILPPTGPLEHDHFDIAFLRLAVHNSTRYNPAIFATEEGALHDWEIFNALSAKIYELKGQDFKPLPAPDVIIDMGIKNGHYGAEENPSVSLTLDKIKQAEHGLDLGPLQTGLAERVCTHDGLINLAPSIYLDDLPRLLDTAKKPRNGELLLIGRRHVRSNNSWMLNYHRLVKGKPRWQLMMHPDDLATRNISDESEVKISSRVGSVITTVQATDQVMPGVVSLPHGWGHQKKGVKMQIASQQRGVNCNELTDDKLIDQMSGNAVFNGVPVTVEAVG